MPPYDSNYKMKPPLRGTRRRRRLPRASSTGTIDAIATDHAPHRGREKMQEFERCPFGIIGLETAVALALERLYHPGHSSLSHLIQLFTKGPANIVLPGRGTLREGAPADVTILGLDHEWTYDVTRSPSKSRNTPFHMKKFRGGPVATIVGGEIVWRLDA